MKVFSLKKIKNLERVDGSKKSLSKDYKTSKELNKTIYHLNEHSNGYKYRLYWSKNKNTFPDIYKYNLSLVRQNKRKLA